jgi:hypothetical protein
MVFTVLIAYLKIVPFISFENGVQSVGCTLAIEAVSLVSKLLAFRTRGFGIEAGVLTADIPDSELATGCKQALVS